MNQKTFQGITIKELLDRYPHLLKLFMALGLACPGCPAEAFHTVEDTAKEYGYDPEELIQHIHKTIQNGE